MSELFGQTWEVIDAHTRFYSYNYFRLISQIPGQYGDIEQFMRRQARRLKIDLPPADPARLAGHWVGEMDRYGVSRVCVLAGLPGDEFSITEAVRSFPDRFIGFVMINPYLAIAEDVLEHAVREAGVRGVCLHPCRFRFHASDERIYPVYRLARHHRLIVYVDYGAPDCPVAAKWQTRSNHDLRFNNPQQLHFAAADFPTVPFVISHCTEEHERELLRLGLLCPNVYASTPYFDTAEEVSDNGEKIQQCLEMLLQAFGHRRLLFGTGSGVFPRGWRSDVFRLCLGAMRNLGLSDEQIALILGGNLKRLLRLDDSRLTYLITL